MSPPFGLSVPIPMYSRDCWREKKCSQSYLSSRTKLQRKLKRSKGKGGGTLIRPIGIGFLWIFDIFFNFFYLCCCCCGSSSSPLSSSSSSSSSSYLFTFLFVRLLCFNVGGGRERLYWKRMGSMENIWGKQPTRIDGYITFPIVTGAITYRCSQMYISLQTNHWCFMRLPDWR